MKALLTFAAVAILSAAAAAAESNQLTSEEKAAGWRLLFDGKGTDAWRGYKKAEFPKQGWAVEEGCLRKLPKVQGGDIVTREKFTDYEFAWDWKIAAKGNNGLKYLVTEERAGAPGHEYQMLDDDGHPDGKIGPKRQTASFYDVLPPATGKPLRPVGEWNTSRLVVKGNHVEHWLNGAKVVEYELGSAAVKAAIEASKFKKAAAEDAPAPRFGAKIPGHLLLTDHQDECWFRNMKVRELPAK